MSLNAKAMPLGPVMLDVAGLELTQSEREVLLHPRVGGVILFARNYASVDQVTRLVADIHALRTPRLLVCVDHEGGRVQRFREGFTRLPPMGALGREYDRDPGRAKQMAHDAGAVLALELRACGVDFSFAPVLDLDFGRSGVIGDRAFHGDPRIVGELALALMQGLARGGMPSVGKHFPGHGFAEADSHTALPIDNRTLAELEARDLIPFGMLAREGLEGVMPAHVLYPQIDPDTAGYSRFWLQEVLRKRLQFKGVIFSDDLTMVGAHNAGGIVERGVKALQAGCDMVLVCNDANAGQELVSQLDWACSDFTLGAMAKLAGRPAPASMAVLRASPVYASASSALVNWMQTITA